MIRHPWSARDSMQGGALRRTPTLALPAAPTCLLIVCARASSYHVSSMGKRSIAHVNSDNLEPAADLSRVLTLLHPPSRTRPALVAQHKLIPTDLLPLQKPRELPIPCSEVCLSHTGRQLHHRSSRQDPHRLIRIRKTQARCSQTLLVPLATKFARHSPQGSAATWDHPLR